MTHVDEERVVAEFRAHAGRVGGYERRRLLLLTTRGPEGARTTPLTYLPDGDRVLVVAPAPTSSDASATRPAWFRDVVADPVVTVEDGPFAFETRAEVLGDDARDGLLGRLVEAGAAADEDEARTVVVVALPRARGGPPPGVPWGQALVLLHDTFRRELALIRDEVARGGPAPGAQLRVACLTVCAGLHQHHHGEDAGMFPMLARDAAHGPALAPVLDRLRAEHAVIAALLDELRAAVRADGSDGDAVLREVDRLVEELGRHLAYEEEQLVPVLDAAGG
ncbi:nitroreductase/quinone reductase family protein [Cellulomonas sp. 179-A 9B4 NHS]|uniref:nitroreductase/quinone reductase family protein n=1 Tax=Cellulomonas sp. 179-A 9B4 NHS TaxID=3142379 RepID=UPI0039A37712